MALDILLISPAFVGFENKIRTELEKDGHNVVWIENKILTLGYHNPRSKFRFLRKFLFALFFVRTRIAKYELRQIGNKKIDILFSINGHLTNTLLMKKLKKRNPSLYAILYLWDSFSMYDWRKDTKYYDRVLTFDRKDAETYNIEYKPNFYIANNQLVENVINNDLFFVGKFNSGRISLLESLLKQLKATEIRYFIRLWPSYKIFPHKRFVYTILKRINLRSEWCKNYILNYEVMEGMHHSELLTIECLQFEEVEKRLHHSNVVLDLPFSKQTGYSHRLIEALSLGKKILTTNSGIKSEEFYNPSQIQILDPINPIIDINWIKEASKFPIDNFLLDLELSNWLKSIINVKIFK